MAIMKTMEAMPQEIPNMVRALRSLCAQMSRQRLQQDLDQKGHGNTSLSPSFNPPDTCVRWPLEMPILTGALRQPCLVPGASNCTQVLLSFS